MAALPVPLVIRYFTCLAIFLALCSFCHAFGRNGESTSPVICSNQLSNCTRIVQPFVNDSRYMFPTTGRDVQSVCKIWSRFVECIRRYMVECSTDDQRTKFHSAVENSVDTVHAICSTDKSLKDYLQSAECFKQVSVKDCGPYYNVMINQVMNPYSQDEHICCSFSQFQQCSQELLQHQCGNTALTLMEHSLNFFTARCKRNQHYSLSYRCPTAPPPLELDMYPPLSGGSVQAPPSLARSLGDSMSTTSGPTPYPWAARTVIYTMPPTQSSRTGTNEATRTTTRLSSVFMMAVTVLLLFV